MKEKIITWWRKYSISLAISVLSCSGRLMLKLSTLKAGQILDSHGPVKVLVDSATLGHGVTHETDWISTGTQKWGDIDFDGGYLARIPVHSTDDKSDLGENARYLASIAYLAETGRISLWTSAELQAERFYQPLGRFSGYGYYDLNVFSDLEMKSVDGNFIPDIHSRTLASRDFNKEQNDRLVRSGDILFQTLFALLGQKYTKDAWHIRTAEKYEMFCFLTLDFRLLNQIENLKEKEPIKSLKTCVWTPKQFGSYFKIQPVPTKFLSYRNADFPVRSDLHQVNNMRRSKNEYKKTE
ncbi:hypothetical protein [Sneathiella sp.]|uniref:hypothetical protein n=1 Tax=Sneathiella sp. TaxID=1964365 RepID=UPI0026064DA2|nr:hypothetical protein [Sneathiella sp.]MDF2367237.1 hypothetical protein [Sneathiella sp.]